MSRVRGSLESLKGDVASPERSSASEQDDIAVWSIGGDEQEVQPTAVPQSLIVYSMAVSQRASPNPGVYVGRKLGADCQ
ncbi:hypothetical protein STEG23_021722, partial [Scotinomys teguina]